MPARLRTWKGGDAALHTFKWSMNCRNSSGRTSCSANIGAQARLKEDCIPGDICGITTGSCSGCETLKLKRVGSRLLPAAGGRPYAVVDWHWRSTKEIRRVRPLRGDRILGLVSCALCAVVLRLAFPRR